MGDTVVSTMLCTLPRRLIATSFLACTMLVLPGCATQPGSLLPLLNQRPPAQILLLGEQHDAPHHHVLEYQVVASLLRHGRLGVLALEMAEQGRSTAGLKPYASEDRVQNALAWNDGAWPWADYGPAIMAAVREEVPVIGANLPRQLQREAMRNEALDGLLTADNLKKQEDAIVEGHCGLLAVSQIRPMTRIQMARDQTMAQTLVQALKTIPPPSIDQVRGIKPVVLLIAGRFHVDRQLGVPQQLPADLSVKVISLESEGATGPQTLSDAIWPTAPTLVKDYCAAFKDSRPPIAQP